MFFELVLQLGGSGQADQPPHVQGPSLVLHTPETRTSRCAVRDCVPPPLQLRVSDLDSLVFLHSSLSLGFGGSGSFGFFVGGTGVSVGTGVLVGVFVGVSVGVFVGVFVGVSVGVFVAVLVGVFVGVSVGVFVAVLVGVFVGVSVGIGVLVGGSVMPSIEAGGETPARFLARTDRV